MATLASPQQQQTLLASDMSEWANGVIDRFENATLQPAMERCTEHINDQVQESFTQERDPFGEQWPPWNWRPWWAPDDHKTLNISGALRASYLGQGDGKVERVSDRSLEKGSNLPYARIQHEGGTAFPPFGMVRRGGKGWLAKGTGIEIIPRQVVGWPISLIEKCEEEIYGEMMDWI